MTIRCIRDGILFAFLQQTTAHGMFVDQTKWGFELTPGSYLHGKDREHFQRAMDIGRWAKVLAVGPECKEVQVGDYICIEPTMYSNSFEYDGVKIRKTDETKVMLLSKEKPEVHV